MQLEIENQKMQELIWQGHLIKQQIESLREAGLKLKENFDVKHEAGAESNRPSAH